LDWASGSQSHCISQASILVLWPSLWWKDIFGKASPFSLSCRSSHPLCMGRFGFHSSFHFTDTFGGALLAVTPTLHWSVYLLELSTSKFSSVPYLFLQVFSWASRNHLIWSLIILCACYSVSTRLNFCCRLEKPTKKFGEI